MGTVEEGSGVAYEEIDCSMETETLALAEEADPEPIQAKSATEAANEVSKVPCLQDQTDVHTRLPLLEDKQEKQQPKVIHRTVPMNLLEVFSVRFVNYEQYELKQMYGCILIDACPPYAIFSRKYGDPLYTDSEGFVKIRGPDVVIKPSNFIDIYPHLFRYEARADQYGDSENGLMWNYILDESYDMLLSRTVRSQFGQIEVRYAVYKCGVEACVDVTLVGCQFSSGTVYGRITAQNSRLKEKGESYLFNRDKDEGVSIDVGACKNSILQLPLARSKTAHPIDSYLTIYVNIWQNSVIGAEGEPIAKDEKLEFTAILGERVVKTIIGTACQINLGVTWPEKPERRKGRFYA